MYGEHVCADGFEQRLRDMMDGGALGDPSAMNNAIGAGAIFIVGSGFSAGGVVEADAVATSGTGPDSVTVYRNVDGREFDDIAATGKWGTGFGMMEGKWFALQGEHADKWGDLMNGGQGLTMEQTIPKSLFDQLTSIPTNSTVLAPGCTLKAGRWKI